MKKNLLTKLLQKTAEKQINDTINQKCIFLCYQPNIPESLICKIKLKQNH